ncbi:DUF86 domain-containing protein [soil metagenome]
MVDADRLLAILGRVTARLRILSTYADANRTELVADRVQLGDLKYTFQTALEACIDAAHHVVADQGLGVPTSNADAFRQLADAGLVDHDLAQTMGAAARFRNVLVHDYAEVDDQRVIDHLRHLPEIRRFVTAMTGLLDDDREAPADP